MIRLVLIVSYLYAVCGSEILVQTPAGKIRGRETMFEGRAVHEFLGIPYAKPPVEELRFKPPVVADPLEQILDATNFSSPCMQPQVDLPESMKALFSSEKAASEDCLYLNVWVPKEELSTKRPVMVLIHGGGFLFGATDNVIHSALPVAAIGNLVTVSMNYRLGVFGFLNADVSDAPGNQGLRDQNLALQWIKTNIEYFGGDRTRITLFGESSGSMSISAHLLSPMSKGLFQRAILAGGSILSPALLQNAQKNIIKGNKLAGLLGCTANGDIVSNPNECLQCIRGKKASEILLVQSEIAPSWANSFMPTYGDPFLSENPLGRNDFPTADVELLIGTAQHEGAVFLRPINSSKLFVPPEVHSVGDAVRFMEEIFSIHDLGITLDDVKLYFDNLRTVTRDTLVEQMRDLIGDLLVVCPSVMLAELHATNGNPVFFYSFAHKGKKTAYPSWVGVPHGSDFMYMNGLPFVLREGYTDEDRSFSQTLIKSLASFASTGKQTSLMSVPWKLFNNPKQFYLSIVPESPSLYSRPRGPYCSYLKKKFL